MSMNISEEEIKAWWDEFERELANMVKPCVPMPIPMAEQVARQPKWVDGNVFYTLSDDMQFSVQSTHTNAKGWNYE